LLSEKRAELQLLSIITCSLVVFKRITNYGFDVFWHHRHQSS